MNAESLTDVTGNQVAALLLPTAVTLVSAYDANGEPCVATIAWAMPISHEPSILAVSIRPGGRTSCAMAHSGAFVVSTLPATEQGEHIAVVCGTKKGIDDRFAQAGIQPVEALHVHAPRVDCAVSTMECELLEHEVHGDHELFLGQVVLAQTQGTLDGSGAVVPAEVLAMGQRGAFGSFVQR